MEVSLPVWIDGLTRKVLSVTAKGRHWFPASQASRAGLWRSPPPPENVRAWRTSPWSPSTRSSATSRPGGAQREVIGITGIGKSRRYAREAVALAYQAPGEELLITLAIDGESSEEHDAAFARATARSARKLIPEDWHEAREIADHDDPAEVSTPRGRNRERAHRRRAPELRHEDTRLRSAAESAPQMSSPHSASNSPTPSSASANSGRSTISRSVKCPSTSTANTSTGPSRRPSNRS